MRTGTGTPITTSTASTASACSPRGAGGNKPGRGDRPWILSGQTASGGPFRLELTGTGVLLELAGGRLKWTASGDFGHPVPPEGSGGMLPALYLWRQLAAAGPDQSGRLDYLGTIPAGGAGAPADVLSWLRDGVETWFYFDAAGRLVALEMWPDPAADPCEIRFAAYGAQQGPIPGRIEVHHGDEMFAAFSVEQSSTQ